MGYSKMINKKGIEQYSECCEFSNVNIASDTGFLCEKGTCDAYTVCQIGLSYNDAQTIIKLIEALEGMAKLSVAPEGDTYQEWLKIKADTEKVLREINI